MARLHRRPRIEQPRPGTGTVMLHLPFVRMLEHHGVEPVDFIRMVRRGRLSFLQRDFIHPDHVKARLPALPHLKGIVTWRRAELRYFLDIHPMRIDDGDGRSVLFWSCFDRNHSQIRFDGIDLPETVMQTLPGRPLRDVLDHPWFSDEHIVIHDGTVTRPDPGSPVPAIAERPAMTSFRVTVPRIAYPDQV